MMKIANGHLIGQTSCGALQIGRYAVIPKSVPSFLLDHPDFSGSGCYEQYRFRTSDHRLGIGPSRLMGPATVQETQRVFQRAVDELRPHASPPLTAIVTCVPLGVVKLVEGETMQGYEVRIPTGSSVNRIPLWCAPSYAAFAENGFWLTPVGYSLPLPVRLLQNVRGIFLHSQRPHYTEGLKLRERVSANDTIHFYDMEPNADGRPISSTFWHAVGHIIFAQASQRLIPLLIMTLALDLEPPRGHMHHVNLDEFWADCVSHWMDDYLWRQQYRTPTDVYVSRIPHAAVLVDFATQGVWRQLLLAEQDQDAALRQHIPAVLALAGALACFTFVDLGISALVGSFSATIVAGLLGHERNQPRDAAFVEALFDQMELPQ